MEATVAERGQITLPKFPGYAELRFGKSVYVMKPVASETGAIRLEDVKGETLVIQIANKSMLLNEAQTMQYWNIEYERTSTY